MRDKGRDTLHRVVLEADGVAHLLAESAAELLRDALGDRPGERSG